jgi:hypothetical protein
LFGAPEPDQRDVGSAHLQHMRTPTDRRIGKVICEIGNMHDGLTGIFAHERFNMSWFNVRLG